MDIYSASGLIQIDIGNKPLVAQPRIRGYRPVSFMVAYPGLTIFVHRTTEKPGGPNIQRRHLCSICPMAYEGMHALTP